MSPSERRSRVNGCELKPYTNWPLILGAMALLVAGGVAVGLMPRKTPTTPTKARHRPVADATAARVFQREEPAATPAAEEDDTPFRPAVVEHVEMLGKPRIETAASLALERMTFDGGRDALALRSPRLKLAVLSEEQMLRLLVEKSKEIDIGAGALALLSDRWALAAKTSKGPIEASHRALGALVRSRADLDGLPLVAMEYCVLSKEESKALAAVSPTRGRRGSPRSPHARATPLDRDHRGRAARSLAAGREGEPGHEGHSGRIDGTPDRGLGGLRPTATSGLRGPARKEPDRPGDRPREIEE